MSENNNNEKFKNLPKESAGRILTERVPIVSGHSSIRSIEDVLLKKIRDFDNINYIYVVDENKKLSGVISIKEIFRVSKDILVKDVMVKDPVSVRPHTDRERAALLAIKHNIKDVPVVDKNNVFLGIVSSDTILNVLHQEGIEDALRSEGILKNYSVKEFISTRTSEHFRKRLPWLLVGLFGGMFAAFIVSFFEDMLSKLVILTAFIPAVVYMADAVGSQTQTIFVRSLSLSNQFKIRGYLAKEISISFSLSIFLGIMAGILVWWWQSFIVALIVAVSFVFTIFFAALSGILLPWIFFKFKLDPAIASGPFSTVLRDISSILIYFGVAFLLLI